MGTHPNAPSLLLDTREPLSSLFTTQEEAEEMLSPKIIQKFGRDLPFLFKVLSIRKALSIQAHPDKLLASKLFKEFPDLYKDGNHKPEMVLPNYQVVSNAYGLKARK